MNASVEISENPRLRAEIRESDCIGCTKCIAACPVDAILGSRKHMHTVIADECIGCQLCVPPCPVDCIDLLVIADHPNDAAKKQQEILATHRSEMRMLRLANEKKSSRQLEKNQSFNLHSVESKQAYIQAAVERVKRKKV